MITIRSRRNNGRRASPWYVPLQILVIPVLLGWNGGGGGSSCKASEEYFYGITQRDANSIRFCSWFSVIGNLPLQLNCSYPGKWSTIKSVSKKNDAGEWQEVPAAVGVIKFVCKTTRVQGFGSYCTVRGKIPGIKPDDEIKVEYFCWEIGKIWTH